MKQLVLSIVFVLAASFASAQERPEMLMFPMGIPCTPTNPDLYNNFEQNLGELPMLRGDVIVQSVNGQEFDVTLEMFVNPNTKNFTLVVYFEDGDMACILTVGDDLTPFVQGDEI
jgi:hypothetical protein